MELTYCEWCGYMAYDDVEETCRNCGWTGNADVQRERDWYEHGDYLHDIEQEEQDE